MIVIGQKYFDLAKVLWHCRGSSAGLRGKLERRTLHVGEQTWHFYIHIAMYQERLFCHSKPMIVKCKIRRRSVIA